MPSWTWAPCIFIFFCLRNRIPLREGELLLHMVSGLGHIESKWERQCWFTLLPSIDEWGGTMGAGQARGPGRPGLHRGETDRALKRTRIHQKPKWESQVRLLVGNRRQEALWNVQQRLYTTEQTAAVWSCTHITEDSKKNGIMGRQSDLWPDSLKCQRIVIWLVQYELEMNPDRENFDPRRCLDVHFLHISQLYICTSLLFPSVSESAESCMLVAGTCTAKEITSVMVS